MDAQCLNGLAMSDSVDTVDALILDLLEWVGTEARPYEEVMEVWRTSCPRLPVWEDANARGFVEQHHEPGRGRIICLSAAGAAYLQQERPNRVGTG